MFSPVQPRRSLYHFVHSWASVLLLPRSVHHTSTQQKSCTSKTSDFEFHYYLQKSCDTQYTLLLSPWSREVFNLCEPITTLSQLLSLFIPFLSLKKGFTSLCSTIVFFSPSSLPGILCFPCCLCPTMEILFPVLRLISWVFQVI